AAGRAPARALQRAQAAVRGQARWQHPFYWAGFYLVERETPSE
ncbi:MAG: CHAT domain-containing protein, partial [Roseateles sp.]